MAKKKTNTPVLHTPACMATYHRNAGQPADESTRLDVEDTIAEHLVRLAAVLAEGKAAIKGDCHGWTPRDASMQNWLCSDGGELRTDSLLALLCHALGYDVANLEIPGCWELDSGWFLIPARMAKNQARFEECL